jgi:hypothetical protein
MRPTCNPVTADLQLSTLNIRYAFDVRFRTPDVFRTPAKHFHPPTIAVKLGFLNQNNNRLEFPEGGVTFTVFQVLYNQAFLRYKSSVCYNSTDASCTRYVPQETSSIVGVTEQVFAWNKKKLRGF